MRPFQMLIACALSTTAWFSSAPALAQPQASPGSDTVLLAEPSPEAARSQVTVSVSPPSLVIPAPIPATMVAPPPPAPLPYAPIYVQPPAATQLANSSVLLMPQELVLSGKGTWERRGNELFLKHSGAGNSRRSGMIAAGITLLAVAYTPALITGGLMTLFEGVNATGSSLLIPVAGPFLSGLSALSPDNDLGLSGRGAQTWAWTWMLVDGAVQVTGLALIIAGARSRPSATPSFLERVHVLPYSTQNGAGVTVSGKF